MLREQGYRTRWYGKWHLTHRDGKWGRRRGERAMQRYGFHGGTYPSPNGAPGQGWRVDGHIARQFGKWFAEEGGAARGARPFRSSTRTTSPGGTCGATACARRRARSRSRRRCRATSRRRELLTERNKPVLQRSLQDTAAASFGPVPYEGPEAAQLWMQFLNLYGKLQREVDVHIGQVLAALNSRPQVAANTVIVFTSDHGEYGGSHGLRGKGAAAYEEAMRVPLMVKDNRGELTQAPETTRSQLTSSVDIAPLLLTIATGSNAWRSEAHYEHLAGRADLAAMLADPNAPGAPVRAARHRRDRHRVRDRVLRGRRAAARRRGAHAGSQVRDLLQLAAGRHRTADRLQERELYDYGTDSGRLELHNSAGESKLEDGAAHDPSRRPSNRSCAGRCRHA